MLFFVIVIVIVIVIAFPNAMWMQRKREAPSSREAPTSKHQAPGKHQTPISKYDSPKICSRKASAARRGPFGIWSLMFPWCLVLGAWCFDLPCHATIPENDSFTTRIALFGTNLTTTGSNVDATKEPGEPDPSFQGGKSVWWTWTPPSSGYLTLSTTGSDFDTMLTVFTGNVLSNLDLVAF